MVKAALYASVVFPISKTEEIIISLTYQRILESIFAITRIPAAFIMPAFPSLFLLLLLITLTFLNKRGLPQNTQVTRAF